MMFHHHDTAIGKSRAQLQMQRRFRSGGEWTGNSDGVDAVRRRARHGETLSYGLLRKFRGTRQRSGLDSLPV